MKANGDTIRTKWVVILVVGSFTAIVLVATLQPAATPAPNIILPTPETTETVFLAPSPGPTVTVQPRAQDRTIIVREPGQRTTVIIVSPRPYPSPYPSPCDPTPAVGNCPPGRRFPEPPATPSPRP